MYKVQTYGNQDSDTAIVVPISADREEETMKTVNILLDRAKTDCKVCLVIEEKGWSGWVAAHNWAFKNIPCKYYCYSCGDYYPSRRFLLLAKKEIEDFGIKLVAFNDGKWYGAIATAGLVDVEWAKQNYNGELFYPGYKHHYADTELSMHAINQGLMAYNPDAVLMEIDYEDKFKGSGFIYQPDNHLFKRRCNEFRKTKKIKEKILDIYS